MELFDKLTEEHIDFIKDQKVFFVATGVAEGTINLSPKGLDSLRVIESDRILWMNLYLIFSSSLGLAPGFFSQSSVIFICH